MGIKTLTVSELNSYLKRILMYDPILNNIMIKGEISNFKLHNSGHCYFSLKDANSKLRCVMFSNDFRKLKFMPEDGMNVIAKGYISIYERNGEYQLYVSSLEQVGLGKLYLEFEKLKEILYKKGYFDENKKKPIPFFPRKIAVVTSPTGAAVRDVISVVTRRNNLVDILVYPVLVQGEKAPLKISEAIEELNNLDYVDLIILTRGGGSIEELWAFNEEIVAESIFHSRIPIISAIGHETDFTISDFVSDLRAPTPSAAGEIAVPSLNEVRNAVDYSYNNLKNNMVNRLSNLTDNLNSYNEDRIKRHLFYKIKEEQQTLDHMYTSIKSNIKIEYTVLKEILTSLGDNLNNLSPLSTIERGYSILMDENKTKTISNIDDVHIGDNVNIMVKNGTLRCIVNDKMKGESIFDK
ncbi:exodeoxyribonuclease VII large subunit [Paramaledivibacter caminithermalis]|uniref:Exodeoxyribonuclease 7 large subunit n=1 Tax=Paramaledivibacter caminithermalis (strain DSM 15212 / CIP 107654 / DViRD3) TaxID=1121301 RepID=A0A1M6JQD4_PARC5|nr:exodeoxyribonuclease VII large subunit [Paramaledivibacter caminithermalis]SHJ48965.1 Exodeoxyribonuclease VII large subunit [Paramaledivibacter caminithermalis DSM 15212]